MREPARANFSSLAPPRNGVCDPGPQADAARRKALEAELKQEFDQFERKARDELAARIKELRERAQKDSDNYEALDPPSRAKVDEALGKDEPLEETLNVIEQVRRFGGIKRNKSASC